jgi:hypothetical protein
MKRLEKERVNVLIDPVQEPVRQKIKNVDNNLWEKL